VGWLVIGGDAVDGQGSALDTLMDQHQLASFIKPILVPAILHRQPDGLHLPLARRETVTCGI